MRQAFEKVAQTYETVKKTVKEKWENFKNKFEGIKSKASQEIMKAESPDDLIASGKKLQEQGEALKIEKDGVEKEELQGKGLEEEKSGMIEGAHEEALEENRMRDKAEEAEKEKQQAIENTKKEAEDAQKAEEILETIKSGSLENSQNEGKRISEDLSNSLKEIFHRFYSPEIDGKERMRIKPEWEAISKKVISKLNKASDFKEYDPYLIGADRDSFNEKWDTLSTQEVKNATTGEEIKEAIKHIRGGGRGYKTPSKIMDIAHDKYEKLTGEPYPTYR